MASVISVTYAASAERLAGGASRLREADDNVELYLTPFLSDAVRILAILNKVMQKDRLTYTGTGLKPDIDTTILALTSLLTTDGPYLADMREHLSAAVSQPDFDYNGHTITDSTKERDKAHAAAKLFVEEVVAILHALTLFEPSQLNATQRGTGRKYSDQHPEWMEGEGPLCARDKPFPCKRELDESKACPSNSSRSCV